MKKTLTLIVICVALIYALFFVLRITGILQSFTIKSGSMMPVLKPKDRIYVSNLKKWQKNSIIVFNRIIGENEAYEGTPGSNANYTFRLIAAGGDMLQIKRGLAYVNGKLADDSTKLSFTYITSAKNYDRLVEELGIIIDDSHFDEKVFVSDTIAIAALSFAEYNLLNNKMPLLRESMAPDSSLFQNTSRKWDVDNYGPIIIPKDYFFVLGDNRHRAADSRYRGFVPEKDYMGAVLGK